MRTEGEGLAGSTLGRAGVWIPSSDLKLLALHTQQPRPHGQNTCQTPHSILTGDGAFEESHKCPKEGDCDLWFEADAREVYGMCQGQSTRGFLTRRGRFSIAIGGGGVSVNRALKHGGGEVPEVPSRGLSCIDLDSIDHARWNVAPTAPQIILWGQQ